MNKPKDTEYISLRQVAEQRLFPWLKSYGGVKKWILKDFNEGNKLETIRICGNADGKSGVRYYIKKQKVLDYAKAFQNNELS